MRNIMFCVKLCLKLAVLARWRLSSLLPHAAALGHSSHPEVSHDSILPDGPRRGSAERSASPRSHAIRTNVCSRPAPRPFDSARAVRKFFRTGPPRCPDELESPPKDPKSISISIPCQAPPSSSSYLSWRVFVAVNLTVAVRFGCGWWRWRCLGRFYMERNPINGLSRPAFGYSYPLCVLVPAASCTHAVPDRRSRDRIGTNFRGSLMSLFLA
uniref:(northern house mosquito) hypothetical protein n=1 Tax=Culex pipiens TaxID=7175 RepID=A0A8D8FS79_CULPI